jgi:thiamine-phosphate pyrophosphorylase
MNEALSLAGAERAASNPAPRAGTNLPRLLLIADGFVTGRSGMPAEAVRDHVLALVEAGVRAVHLRDHEASPEAFADRARSLAARLRTRRPDLVLFVNGYPAVAKDLGAIPHVGHRGPSVAEARAYVGPGARLSYAAHSPTDALRAVRAGADVLLVSPLFRTLSHPGETPGEIVLLRRACTALAGVEPRPCVYGLGGIQPEHVASCLEAGAHGVAVLSGLLDAPDPEAAARAYLDALGAPDARGA